MISRSHCCLNTEYFGTAINNNINNWEQLKKNQNSIAEEIKSKIRSGNDSNHSVQNLLSSRFLFKNLIIQVCRTIILPVVFYG